MDEMMNMNETTMENETSVEVVPEENVHHFIHFCYLFHKYKFIMLEYYLHKGS